MKKGRVRWREERKSQFPFRGRGVDLGKSPSCTVGNIKTHYVQWLHGRIALQTTARSLVVVYWRLVD
jgi:hypothetical protein